MYIAYPGLNAARLKRFSLDKMIKSRTMNELRQTRDAVYNLPASHDQRMNERLVGDIYVILIQKANQRWPATMWLA